MLRRVIQIDEDACTGCGLCVTACHEGAIQLIDGKARLVRDDYCDGLGDCLPSCPVGAITFVEREAAPYDEAAVIAAKMLRAQTEGHASVSFSGCPGSMARSIDRPASEEVASASSSAGLDSTSDQGTSDAVCGMAPSRLTQWPVQIKLVPVNAPYFEGADVLVAADCAAFAYGAFHEDYIKGRVCLVGCPKLDGVDYAEKLGAIFAANDVRSVLVARMQVPCCGGIESAVQRAVSLAGRDIPVRVDTISADGRIVSSR